MPKPGNFGDILTPYILDKLFNIEAVYTQIPAQSPVLISIGSVISRATSKNVTIWGSGAMKITDQPNPAANYLAVRGPRTRDIIIKNGGECPEIYGDPALLLPKVYDNPQDKKYKIGFVPHYVDYQDLKNWYPHEKVINLLDDNIERVIDQMRQCDRIVSSSLHGIIVATAYGIPATWVKLSNRLYGDSTKFYDFFDSVKVKHECVEVFERPELKFWDELDYISDIDIDLEPLINSFPKT